MKYLGNRKIERVNGREYHLDPKTDAVVAAYPFVENGTARDNEFKIEYKNGIRDGYMTVYGGAGEKRMETHYLCGLESGLRTNYHEDGSRTERIMCDDEIHEMYIYDREDIMVSFIPHQDGVPHGLAFHSDETGKLERKERWHQGKLHGDSEYYFRNGKRLVERYEAGVLINPVRLYDKDGRHAKDIFYRETDMRDNRTETRRIYYDPMGRITYDDTLTYTLSYDYDTRQVTRYPKNMARQYHGVPQYFWMDRHGEIAAPVETKSQDVIYAYGVGFDVSNPQGHMAEFAENEMYRAKAEDRLLPREEWDVVRRDIEKRHDYGLEVLEALKKLRNRDGYQGN